MSDAMTNREIEDVLTSIRRLVAQEGTRPSDPGRLILTEAQRVSAVLAADSTVRVVGVQEVETAVETNDHGATATTQHETASSHDLALPEPDFGKLEATIAELEAAVSASGEPWEPEVSAEFTPRPSNVTDLYGRLNFVHRAGQADAEGVPAAPLVVPTETSTETSAETSGEASGEASVSDLGLATAIATNTAPDGRDTDDDTDAWIDTAAHSEGGTTDRVQASPLLTFIHTNHDHDLDDHENADDHENDHQTASVSDEHDDDTILDEAVLRSLISLIVREELHGQLGERITQQVRKLVRAEIAKALDDRTYL